MKTVWGVIAGVAGGILLAILWWRNPWSQVKKEMRAIEDSEKARQMVLDDGAAVTRKRIESEHRATIQGFDDDQKQRLKSMRSDPVALARWLNRVSD